jgi:hypothetical protein
MSGSKHPAQPAVTLPSSFTAAALQQLLANTNTAASAASALPSLLPHIESQPDTDDAGCTASEQTVLYAACRVRVMAGQSTPGLNDGAATPAPTTSSASAHAVSSNSGEEVKGDHKAKPPQTAAASSNTSTLAAMHEPWGVAVNDSGDVFVADSNNHCIRRLSRATNQLQLFAGSGSAQRGFRDSPTASTANGALFHTPTAVIIHPSTGVLYVAVRLIQIQGCDSAY